MMRMWEIWKQMHIVEHLWQMSLLAGLLIGFVLVLRLLLRKYSKGYSYALWLLVLLRLLCPIFIESGCSMQPLFLAGETAGVPRQDQGQPSAVQMPLAADGLSAGKEDSWRIETDGSAGMPGEMGTEPNGNYAVLPSENSGNSQSVFFKQDGQNSLTSWGKAAGSVRNGRNEIKSAWERGWFLCLPWLKGIYVLGAGALMLYFAALYILWRRKLADAVHIKENIWCSDRVESPFVLGVLRPRIYLPYGLRAQEEYCILLHEQSHIRHKDPLLRLLGTLALCLHWWNPLVWLGIHLFYQDMEMFCDEAAMAQTDLSGRQAYSAALLQFAIRQSGPATVLAFGETHTERRIRNILKQKKQGRGITLFVVLAAAAGGIIFLTVPQGTQAGMQEDDMVSKAESASELSQPQQQESLVDYVLSQGRAEASADSMVTLRLVLTEGMHSTYQNQEGVLAENYEGVYELQSLDAQGQLLDRVELVNEQGGMTMSFAYRDFPWYFEDYNRDGQQDFFLGTKGADGGSYYYFFTITAQGELEYLFDGPMEEEYWPMDADFITNPHFEGGGVEDPDYRTVFLYHTDREYSSHDFYTWSPYFGKYRKRVEFTGVYTEDWDQEAVDYLEGDWCITGIDMWSQEGERPEYCIGEILSYTGGAFRRSDAEGNVKQESNIAGCSSLLQSPEEFWNTFDMAWPDVYAQDARRILVNLGEGVERGSVIYVLDDNRMLVYEMGSQNTFWTATRVKLQGEAADVAESLQGTWEVTGIASRPYEALEIEEAQAFLGTRLSYDWRNAEGVYTIEGIWNYGLPIQGVGQSVDNSANWLPEAELPEGELLWWNVDLGEGEFFGNQMVRIDANTVWIYYMGTFFEAKRNVGA